MKLIYATVIVLALTGCATKPVLTGTQIVEVPIATKCEPKMKITDITFNPKKHLTKEMSMFDKLQLVLAQLKITEGQNTELKAALKECTK